MVRRVAAAADVRRPMTRCIHCGRLLWLYQDKSPGKTMHWDCWRVTQLIIQRENQAQYEVERRDTGWSSESSCDRHRCDGGKRTGCEGYRQASYLLLPSSVQRY